MLTADQPISQPVDDLLSRSSFVKRICDGLVNINLSDGGFVLAITGEWGEGKSSVLNLLQLELTHRQMQEASKQPVYVGDTGQEVDAEFLKTFCPLHHKAQGIVDQLSFDNKDSYFANGDWLKSALRKAIPTLSDNPADLNQLYRYHKLKLHVERDPSWVVVRFSPWLIASKTDLTRAALSEVIKTISGKVPDEITSSFEGYLASLQELISVAGQAADQAGAYGLGTLLAGGLHMLASKKQSETIDSVRAKLKFALRQQDKCKVLVIIDDLDRLTPREAADMMSVIRGALDLPNVAVLLSYDEKALARLLRIELKTDGHLFLEKIVQSKLPLPKLYGGQIIELLSSETQDQFSQTALSFDRAMRDNASIAWRDVLEKFVQTPRAVKRLASAFKFRSAAVSEFTYAPDLLVVECINLYAPGAYRFIRDNVSALFARQNGYAPIETRKAEFETWIRELKQQAGTASPSLAEASESAARYLLGSLFNGVRGNEVQRRFANETYNRMYFVFDAAPSMIPVSALIALQKQGPSGAAFEGLLQSFGVIGPFDQVANQSEASDGRVNLLEDMSAMFDKNQLQFTQWFEAIIEQGPNFVKLVDQRYNFHLSNNIERIGGILRQGLVKLDRKERADLLRNVVNKPDITVATIAVDDCVRQNDDIIYDFSLGDGEEEVVSSYVDRIKALALSGALWLQANPPIIIRFWLDQGDKDEIQTFFGRTLREGVHLRPLYEFFMKQAVSSNEGAHDYMLEREYDGVFLNYQAVYESAQQSLTSNDEKLRTTAQRLIAAYQRRSDA